MIIGAVFMHSFTDRLILKSDQYPLRLVLIRILEFVGKVFIIPGVFCYFCLAFPSFASHATVIPSLVVMFFLFGFIASREAGGFKSAVAVSMVMIRNKIESPATYSLSSMEVLVFNLKMFGVFSRSPSHYHRWKRSVDRKLTEDGSASLEGAEEVPVEMEMAAMSATVHKANVVNVALLQPVKPSGSSGSLADDGGDEVVTDNPMLVGRPSLPQGVDDVENNSMRGSSTGYEL